MKNIVLYSLFSILLTVSIHGQVNTESLRENGKIDGVQQKIKAFIGYFSGNSNYQNIQVGYRLDYNAQDFHAFFDSSYQRKQNEGTNFANNGFYHLRIITKSTNFVSTEGFLQKEFNDFLLLKDRQLIGGGLRFTVQKKATSEIYVGVGGMHENEILLTDPQTETSYLKSSNYISLSMPLIDQIKIKNISYIQVAITELDKYRLLSQTSLSYPISKWLTWNTSINLSYNNSPPSGLEKTDTKLLNTIEIKI